MVQLGLDAVLTGTPAAIAKTKVRLDLVHVLQGDVDTSAEGRKDSVSEDWAKRRSCAHWDQRVGRCLCWRSCCALG